MSDNIFKEIWTIGKFLLLAYALVWVSNSEKMWTDRITKKFLGVTYQEMDTQQATKRSVQIIKDTMENEENKRRVNLVGNVLRQFMNDDTDDYSKTNQYISNYYQKK